MYSKNRIGGDNHNLEAFLKKYGESEQNIAICKSFYERFYDHKTNHVVPELVTILSFIKKDQGGLIIQGMGFVIDHIDNRKVIATCKHVIQNEGNKIIQSLVSKRTKEIVRILATKGAHTPDLAFILTKDNDGENMGKIEGNSGYADTTTPCIHTNTNIHDKELVGIYRQGYDNQYEFRVGSVYNIPLGEIHKNSDANTIIVPNLSIIDSLLIKKNDGHSIVGICDIQSEPGFSGSPLLSEQGVVGMINSFIKQKTPSKELNKTIGIYTTIKTIMSQYQHIKTKLIQ